MNEVLTTQWSPWDPRWIAEGAFSAYTGSKHSVAVNSSTSGLHLTMITAGVGRGEGYYALVQLIASANCAVRACHPVFVDADPLTGTRSEPIEDAITERTKAIIAVHAGSRLIWIPLSRSRAATIHLIEDACEATVRQGAARARCPMQRSSPYPNKQMTTGEGGMVVTDNAEWDMLFRSLRNQGRDVFDAAESYAFRYNYRMDEMLRLAWSSFNGSRKSWLRRRSEWYNERIDHIPGVYKPYIADTTTRMSWFVYVVRFDDGIDRDSLIQFLNERGIPSRAYFTPIHLQPLYRQLGWGRGDLPHTEHAGDTFLALPFSTVMTEEQTDYVCEQLREGMAEFMSVASPV